MKPIVLIVSKKPELIAKNVTILENNGFNTIISSTIDRAKKRMSLYPPHLVIVFYSESLELVNDIRSSVIFKDMPLIVISRDEDFYLAKDIANDLNVEVLNSKDSESKIIDKINLLISKYKLKQVKVEINKKLKIRLKSRIVEINEAGFSFLSHVAFNDLTVCPIRSRFFVKLGFNPLFAILKQDSSNSNLCLGSFIALKEEERANIRKWVNSELTRQS